MQTTRRSNTAKTAARKTTRKKSAEPTVFFARHAKPATVDFISMLPDSRQISGLGWVEVDAPTADVLRVWPACELPGHEPGSPAFKPRFDVLSREEFDALVKAQRAKIDDAAIERAEAAAREAIHAEFVAAASLEAGSTHARKL